MFGATRFLAGLQLIPQNTTTPNQAGELRYNSGTNSFEFYDTGLRSLIVALTGDVSTTGTGTLDVTVNSAGGGTGAFSAGNTTVNGNLFINETGSYSTPALEIGNANTGLFKSNNTAGSIIGFSLDSNQVMSALWNDFPGHVATVTTTGNTTLGGTTITSMGTTVGIFVGMIVTGPGIPNTYGDYAMVSQINSGTQVTLSIPSFNNSGTFSTASAGGTFVFSDPGNAQLVLGTENLPMNLSVSGNNIGLNTSDWSVPQQNSINGNYTDSVVYGSDPDAYGHGAAVAVYARSHATKANTTEFRNQAGTSGSITSSGGVYTWTLGANNTDTISFYGTLGGANGSAGIGTISSGNLTISSSQIGVKGRFLSLDINSIGNQDNCISNGPITDRLIITGDQDQTGAHGASIVLAGRSSTGPSITTFLNSNNTAGTISSLGFWTINNLIGSGTLTIINSTASTPSLATTDADTGIYRSGSHQISISAGGVQQIYAANAEVGLASEVFLNVNANTGASNLIFGNTTSDTLAIGGDTNPGNGGVIKLYSRSASPANAIQFINANVVDGSINGSGLWTIGSSGGTQTHVVNGNLSVTGTITQQPVVCRYVNTAGTVLTRNTWTQVPYPTVDYDPSSAFVGGTGVFTAPSSGYYSVTACTEISGVSGGSRSMMRIKKNGGVQQHGGNFVSPGDPYFADGTMAAVSGIIHLNATDTATVEFWFDDGVANRNMTTTTGGSVISIAKISN
jgi:hypothetical protein